jgi:hypothetical protein
MKKLVLFAAVVAAVAFSSCKKEATPVVEEVPVIEETVTTIEEEVAPVDSNAVLTEEAPAIEVAQ